jgi:hypothetical protein
MQPPRTPRRRGYPPQENVPSQSPVHRTPYYPGAPDLAGYSKFQEPHQPGFGGPPPVYVMTTFDARPISAVDFVTYSGSDPRDTGLGVVTPADPDPPPYRTSSIFLTVPQGRIAIVRDWSILITPESGENLGEGANPVFLLNGGSNFRTTLSFLLDGVFQEGMAARVNYALAFGDLSGECYIMAQAGQIIEMRLTGGVGFNNTTWNQVLMTFHGNLLSDRGQQLEYQAATFATIPVQETGTEALYAPNAENKVHP